MTLVTEDLRRPAWGCVHFVPAEKWKETMIADRYVAELDGTDFTSKDAVICAIARAFDFPDDFGRNWDAVEDYLRDLSWLPASGYVLIVRNARMAWVNATLLAGTLTNIWLVAAEFWARRNVSFHLVWLV